MTDTRTNREKEVEQRFAKILCGRDLRIKELESLYDGVSREYNTHSCMKKAARLTEERDLARQQLKENQDRLKLIVFCVQHFKECSSGSCDSNCKTKARGDMWEALAVAGALPAKP